MDIDDLSNIDLDPVCYTEYNTSILEIADIGNYSPSGGELRNLIREKYAEVGFVRMNVGDTTQPRRKLMNVARELGFDSAFVPPQYSNDKELYDEFGVNQIGLEDNTTQNHRGFSSNEVQEIHVDGTLESIGNIPTTMMLCQSQGVNGGESRIFNSVGAFCQLASEQPKLAKALSSDQALTRSAVDLSGESVTGPAFDINQYGLVNRFSLDNTSKWNIDVVGSLEPALNWMKRKLTKNSGFYTEFQLNPGELLIIANHKVSHGRNEYKDKKGKRRKLFRAIFERDIR